MTDECGEFPSLRELYDFLLKTAQVLASKGRADLANEVEHASKFAWGTSSTEYLDAAQKALMKAKASAVFDEVESAELSKIIRQIEIEFLKIGGA